MKSCDDLVAKKKKTRSYFLNDSRRNKIFIHNDHKKSVLIKHHELQNLAATPIRIITISTNQFLFNSLLVPHKAYPSPSLYYYKPKLISTGAAEIVFRIRNMRIRPHNLPSALLNVDLSPFAPCNKYDHPPPTICSS